MAVEIDAIQSAKSIGWSDALLTRLGANSVALGARLSITAPANSSALSSTGYSLTGSNAQSMIDLAGTWNTTGTPTAIKLNITNTASNAASLLMDLQVGGVSKLKVATTGLVQFVDADVTGMSFTSTGSYGFKYFSLADAGRISMLANSSEVVAIGSGGINIGTNAIGFGANFLTASRDVFLLRDGAANTLALRNAANAQALNIYNTYTSGSVYERGFMRWVSNVLEIGTEHVGATHRAMSFYAEGGISHFIAGVRVLEARSDCIRSGIDNTHDIGQVARTWKDLYQSGFHSLKEMTAPAAPAANTVRIYAVDNGAGKTQLMALFATGAAQQIAIEP